MSGRRFRHKIRGHVVEAMQFTTNNEVGSPTMDAIVNWANQGKPACRAWHNGTDIFWWGETANVGDWCVKLTDTEGIVWPGTSRPGLLATFEEMYEPVEPERAERP